MKRIVLLFVIFSTVVAGLTSFPQNRAYACSCAAGNAKEKLDRSTAVFVGKVIAIGGTQKFQHGRLRKYTFEVEEAWKGVSTNPFTIYSYDGESASCGYRFIRNQTYLVYSYQGNNNLLQTNLCSGNLIMSQADGELQQLGSGITIEKGPEKVFGIDTRKPSYYYFLFGGVIFIVWIIIFILRKRKLMR
jgi:hypothetical protein